MALNIFFSDDEVDFPAFIDDEIDSAIFLPQRKQPLIATKALCIEEKNCIERNKIGWSLLLLKHI